MTLTFLIRMIQFLRESHWKIRWPLDYMPHWSIPVSIIPNKTFFFHYFRWACNTLVVCFFVQRDNCSFLLLDSPVLKENLESHLKRCPLLKQAQSLSHQPYYQKAINAGMEDQGEEGAADLNSESKRKSVYAMNLPEFLELIRKIKSIHASICNDTQDSFKNPVACATWTNRQVDR